MYLLVFDEATENTRKKQTLKYRQHRGDTKCRKNRHEKVIKTEYQKDKEYHTSLAQLCVGSKLKGGGLNQPPKNALPIIKTYFMYKFEKKMGL